MPEQRFDLNWIDYTVILVYFIGVIAHGLWASRGNKNAKDYFLAGGVLPWYLIGFSLFASNMSGSSFVGLMGASYDNGLVVFNYEWTAAAVLVFFAFFILPHFLRHKIYTVPEFLEKRYDRRCRTAFSVFSILAILFIDTAGALYAGGLVITTVIPAFDLWMAVAILAFVAGLYTMLGGLGAVVVTDTVQAILLMVGAGLIWVFGWYEIGGWSAFTQQIDPERLELIKPVTDDFLPWPGLLGVILLGFYYWTLNQFVVQRALGAKSLDQGRKGALFAGFLKLPNLFLMILPGVMAILLYPDLENPDLVFPTLAFDLLPVGLRGIIMSALIAAIMSSLDSALHAASSLVTMDGVKQYRPQTSDRRLMVIGQFVTGGVVIFGAIYAPSIASFESLFQYFQSVLSYIIPPIVVVFIGGIFVSSLTATAALVTIVAGLAVGVPLFVMQEVTGVWSSLGLPAIHFTYMSIIMMLFGIVTISVVSALTSKREHEADTVAEEGMTTLTAPERSFAAYADFRYQSAVLLGLTTALIVFFW